MHFIRKKNFSQTNLNKKKGEKIQKVSTKKNQ